MDTELKPKLRAILECPVCFELPLGPVPVCMQGHHICHQCRLRIDQCPLCKVPYNLDARNYALEEIVHLINSTGGFMNLLSNSPAIAPEVKPKVVAPMRQLTVNQPPPPQSKGEYPCMFCSVSFPVSRMVIHLQGSHANDLKEVDSISNQAQFAVGVPVARSCTKFAQAFKVARLGVFFFNMEMIDDNRYLCLRMVAAQGDADRYKYSIKIPNNSTSFSSKVHSCRQSPALLIRRNDCLLLTSQIVKTVLKDRRIKNKLDIHVTIHREIPEPRPENGAGSTTSDD